MLSPYQREKYFESRKGDSPPPASVCYRHAKYWPTSPPPSSYKICDVQTNAIHSSAPGDVMIADDLDAKCEINAASRAELRKWYIPDPSASGNNGVVTINGEPVARVTKWECVISSRHLTDANVALPDTLVNALSEFNATLESMCKSAKIAAEVTRDLASGIESRWEAIQDARPRIGDHFADILCESNHLTPPEVAVDPAGCAPDYSAARDITIAEG